MAKDPEQSLTLAELRDVRGALSRASGKRRLDLIFDARDPGALVRALPPDELYFTIREIGLADSVELVQFASAEQFKVILDLDTWRQGRFEPRRALPWLRAARVGALDDPRAAARLARKMRALDPELALLIFRDALIIHDLKVVEDPEIESDRTFRTADNAYLIEFLVDGTDYVAVRGLIDDLQAEDVFKLSRLFASLSWELPSELEETALRWRTGRLADLGYPALEEALSWYARPPARPAEAPGSASRAPGFFLAPLPEGTLLGRAAARLELEDREAFEVQLIGAGNAVLVADGIDPVDLDQVRAAVEGARAMVELGLGQLAGGDEARAAELLGTTPVKRLFQEGFGRVLQLCWRAERLFKAGQAGSRATPLLDAPLGETLSALSGRRPRYWTGLDLPRETWGTPAASAQEGRRFLTELDLARTAAALDLCEGLAALAGELGLTPARADGQAPRLSALYLTALCNERLGRPFAPAPIPAAELPAATAALATVEDPRLAARGEAGALLLALARQGAEELQAHAGEAGERPDLVSALLVAT